MLVAGVLGRGCGGAGPGKGARPVGFTCLMVTSAVSQGLCLWAPCLGRAEGRHPQSLAYLRVLHMLYLCLCWGHALPYPPARFSLSRAPRSHPGGDSEGRGSVQGGGGRASRKESGCWSLRAQSKREREGEDLG